MEVAKKELLRVLDEEGNFTGRYEDKNTVHSESLYHNEVALWIINKDDKKVLLQKRSANKKYWPNKYALCVGHVMGDNTIEETLKTEAMKDMKLDISDYAINKITTIKKSDEFTNFCFVHHFYILASIDVDELEIDEDELSEVKYVDYRMLKELVMQDSDKILLKWRDGCRIIFEELDNIIGI